MTGAAAARHQAASILHGSRYRGSSVPRPLHGVLQALGNGLQSAGHAISRAVDAVGSHLPGGAPVAWAILALGVLVLAALVGRLAAGTVAQGRVRRDRAATAAAASAADLLDGAHAAERAGDFTLALRLRFRAGLVALAERGRVRSPASLPSGELSRRLSSEDFDALAHRFDEVAYGGGAAGAQDVEDARARWRELLKEGA
jgi:Domain of unknown function (DUF4129)